MRKRTVPLIAVLFVFAAMPRPAMAGPERSACLRGDVGRAASRLRIIENDRDDSMQGVARRSAALATIAGDRSDLLRNLAACHADARTVARIDMLEVWARLIALRATEAPVYPKPYRNACHAYDVSALQVAFIEAWTARLATHEAPIARTDVWSALGREPLYAHVALLARATADRLGVRDLPTFDSDEERWLADNRNRHEAIAALLATGTSCGPEIALWGMPPVEAAPAVLTAATRP